MKTNKSNFQSTFFLFLLFLSVLNLSAQERPPKDKLNFKIGYSKYSDTDFIFYSTSHKYDGQDFNEVGNLRLSTNFRINRFFDAGLYFGYSLYRTYIPYDFDSIGRPGGYSYENANSIMYGINSNVHILPFFIEKERSRIDVYCALQYGGIHLFEPEYGINNKKNYAEYGIYGGMAFYPFRHMGIYAEYGYGKYVNLRFGLSWKF